MSEVMKIWNKGAHLHDEIYANNTPYHRSHEVIVALLPKKGTIDILDLGAGTGVLAERILKALPAAHVTCVDFAERMIDQSKRRLDQFGPRVELICADMTAWAPTRPYDAIVTCNALVYEDIDMRSTYAKYASALNLGGLFLNSTVVKDAGTPLPSELVENIVSPDAPQVSEEALAFSKGPGRPIAHFGHGSLAVVFTVEEHLEWMTSAGLRAWCPWHYLTQAIIVGMRENSEGNPAAR